MELNSAVSMTPRSFMHMRVSLRNQNRKQKYFSVWVKIMKKGVKNLMTMSILKSHYSKLIELIFVS